MNGCYSDLATFDIGSFSDTICTTFAGGALNNPNLTELAGRTQLVYERNARRFADERPKTLLEKSWLDRFRNLMHENGDVLDLGCGAGEPIASYLIQNGHRVVGLDASKNMIDLARQNIPNGDWRLGDMRTFQFPEHFHGIIGWNSFFHLTRDEQRTTLPIIASHLLPDGVVLLTVGPNDGEVAGLVGDDPIYHASLSQDEYGNILSDQGLEMVSFVEEDPECYGMTILLAKSIKK